MLLDCPYPGPGPGPGPCVPSAICQKPTANTEYIRIQDWLQTRHFNLPLPL